MSLKVKVCGLRDIGNIKIIDALAVDYLGFIFYPESKRYVSDYTMISSLQTTAKKVAVVVNQDLDSILKLYESFKFDAIQFSGNESALAVKEFRKALPNCEVFKAFGVNEEFSFEIDSYQDFVDYYIFDNKTTSFGGSGKSYKWELLDRYKGTKPYFLSGGIKPELVTAVKEFLEKHSLCAGVDLNSGFEDAPASKNIEKLRQFIARLQ